VRLKSDKKSIFIVSLWRFSIQLVLRHKHQSDCRSKAPICVRSNVSQAIDQGSTPNVAATARL